MLTVSLEIPKSAARAREDGSRHAPLEKLPDFNSSRIWRYSCSCSGTFAVRSRRIISNAMIECRLLFFRRDFVPSIFQFLFTQRQITIQFAPALSRHNGSTGRRRSKKWHVRPFASGNGRVIGQMETSITRACSSGLPGARIWRCVMRLFCSAPKGRVASV